MKLKRLVNYSMDFDGKWAAVSSLCMGIAFFAQAIYYFVFADLLTCGTYSLAVGLILPLLLEAAWFIMLRAVRFNSPGAFAILAALLCILLAAQSFLYGNTLRTVLAVLWYLIAAVAVIFVAGGFLPYKVIIVGAFLLPLCVRIVIWHGQYWSTGKYWQGLPEAAGILCVAGLMLFAGTLKQGRTAG